MNTMNVSADHPLEDGQTLPEFVASAPELLETIDEIADHAMQGLEQIAAAVGDAPSVVQPLLLDLMAKFREIGYAADATVSGVGADLRAVWFGGRAH